MVRLSRNDLYSKTDQRPGYSDLFRVFLAKEGKSRMKFAYYQGY